MHNACTVCGGVLRQLPDSIAEQVLPKGMADTGDGSAYIPESGTYIRNTMKKVCTGCGTHHKHITISKDGRIMVNTITTEDAMEATKQNRTALLEKVRILSEQMQETTAMKKSNAASYNDQLKEQKAELEDTLRELKGTPADC